MRLTGLPHQWDQLRRGRRRYPDRVRGSVVRISIAPVKALGLVHPETIELGPQGVAGDRRFWLVDASGRLVKPFDIDLPVELAFYAVYPKSRGQDASVQALVEWLQQEARDT